MRLLIDMNLSPHWVIVMAANGISAFHWRRMGPGDASDGEIMAFALANDLVIVALDLDFGIALATTRGRKPSVVQLRIDIPDPEVIGDKVAATLTRLTDELAHGALVTIDPNRTRVRLLPIS